MPIEFKCQQCGKTLRTGDETAGKQARCPECGTVQPIPGGAAPPPPPLPDNPFIVTNRGGGMSEAPNPYQSPASAPRPPQRPLGGTGKLPIVPTTMEIGEVLNRAFEIFKLQMGPCIGAAAIAIGINIGVSFLGNIVTFAAQLSGEPALVIGAQLLVFVVSTLIQMWVQIGQFRFFFSVGRGQVPVIQDVFSGGPWFLRILGWTLLVYLALGVIGGICLAPGGIMLWVQQNQNQDPEIAVALLLAGGALLTGIMIFLSLRLYQSHLLVIDQDVPVMDSFGTSWEITRGNVLAQFLLGLVAFGLTIAGLLACCVGMIFAIPFVMLAQAIAFLTMSGQFNQPAA